ncbi:DNA-packaging protein [Phaeobacter sp. CNT1-3]|nr:DNA-packaging protein [Phaeobacter sp. CNT1-3]
MTDSGRDPKTGRFTSGNHFWASCSSFGRKPTFTNGDDLWAACVEYFEWVVENPLYEDHLIKFEGHGKHEPIERMRAMTQVGLCNFLDISRQTWSKWRQNRADLAETIERVEAVIYQHKFEGAAADLLNANIIARDLGLSEKRELTGKDGGPIETNDTTDLEAKLSEQAQRLGIDPKALGLGGGPEKGD